MELIVIKDGANCPNKFWGARVFLDTSTNIFYECVKKYRRKGFFYEQGKIINDLQTLIPLV